MTDPKTSTFLWIAGILWALVALFIVGCWIAVTLDQEEVGLAFGFTACAGSAVAATMHIRTFATRICQHMRNAYDLGRESVKLEAVPFQRTPR